MKALNPETEVDHHQTLHNHRITSYRAETKSKPPGSPNTIGISGQMRA